MDDDELRFQINSTQGEKSTARSFRSNQLDDEQRFFILFEDGFVSVAEDLAALV